MRNMRNMRNTILYLISFVYLLNGQTDIWYYNGDITSTDWNGAYSQVTGNTICPGGVNDNCWELNADGSSERTTDTTGYSNVQFTWYMSTSNTVNGNERCVIEYSTDGQAYADIIRTGTKNVDITGTWNTWTVDGINGLRIRLNNVGGGHSCYYNDLRLFGNTAAPTTSNPTTNTPTTNTPTTSNPTTNTPTTNTPTTNTPTTDNPTTSNPTTSNPTTVNPTTSNPTTLNPTTYDPTTANPTTIAPTTTIPNPTTIAPTTTIPTTSNPTTSNPTTKQPTTNTPTSPTTANPTTTTTAPIVYNNWVTVTNPAVPVNVYVGAVAYDSNTKTIYLMGGQSNRRALVGYDITNNLFTNYGTSYFTADLYGGWGQWFVQRGSLLWTISEASGNTFNVFDVTTRTLTTNYEFNNNQITIPTSVTDDGCLASYGDYLLVIGSGTAAQIYNTVTGVWLQNVPQLQQTRNEETCAVINDEVYAIGGYTSDGSVKYLNLGDIVNIHNYNWQPISGSLAGAWRWRAVVFDNQIILTGGCCPISTVYVIDPIAKTLSVNGDLAYAVHSVAPIIADGVFYVFSGSGTQNWQYMDLYTPSAGPTSNTSPPTSSPSNVPSQVTNQPSAAPSRAPSKMPSNLPSRPPTGIPSDSPTQTTNQPSSAPSARTVTPTTAPTLQPTTQTSFPTVAPTTREPCGTNRYCYNVDVFPSKSVTYTMVPIQHPDPLNAVQYFEIYWQIKGAWDCLRPAITLRYEQIDTSLTTENILVQANSGATIQNCQGEGVSDSRCNIWWTCFSDRILPDANIILSNNTYKITLTEGSSTDALCSSYHSFSINAELSLRCDTTLAPTNDPTKTPSATPTQTTSIPTNAPSLAPTLSPSSAPTQATDQPSATPSAPPTSIPSNTPSQPPSSAPSAPPTNIPSGSPSQPPTNAPSISPTTPSAPPTNTPTLITLQPSRIPSSTPTLPTTYAPTSTNPQSCGSYRWCWTIYIYPGQSLTTHPVTIQVNDDNVKTYMDINFVPRNGDCIEPLLTLSYQQIDIQDAREYIDVYDNNNGQIQMCQGNGGADTQCNTWWTCFADRAINGGNRIARDSTYQISLIEGEETDDFCSGLLTTNAVLTLTCQGTDAPTSDPTSNPSAAPTQTTSVPTNAPSLTPTFSPSVSPTHTTVVPTNAPSIAPTTPPSNTPSQPPTNAPSKTPTTPPSNTPSQPPTIAPSFSPSNVPSNTPSQPPSIAPSTAPTPVTKQPSNDPTSDPTSDPTNDPTIEPTLIPTNQPSIPSLQPSKAPSKPPSRTPTYQPSIATSQPSRIPSSSPIKPTALPTQSPTLVESCPTPTAPARYCYYMDVYPVSGVGGEKTINVRQAYDSSNSHYEIFFTPRGGPCINPSMTLSYEQIDILSSGEYVEVFEDSYSEGDSRRRCQGNGGADTQCGTWWTCFSNLALRTTYIPPDQQYNIRLYSPTSNNALCNSVKINANFKITCDSTTFTSTPTTDPTTPFPTLETLQPTPPTLSPTTNPTVTLCGKATSPNSYCYTRNVASVSTTTISTYNVNIDNYGTGIGTESTYIYFSATNICYSPYITVTYVPANVHPLSILNHNDLPVGQCTNSALQCNNIAQDCVRDASLGISELEAANIYIVSMHGTDLSNNCASSYTTRAVVSFVCDKEPTPQPTNMPTLATDSPTTNTPTKVTAVPTPAPTKNRVDGMDLFEIFIISHWRNNDRLFSLIVATFTNEHVELNMNKLLQFPIGFVTDSITQEHQFCFDSHCIQFWNVRYQTSNCNIDLNADFKYLLKVDCHGIYSEKKHCLDYLRGKAFDNTFLTTLNTNNFIFKDKICSLSVYQHLFTYDIIFYKDRAFTRKRSDNKKYKRGDAVYVELDIDNDVFFDAYDITVNNVFACSSNQTMVNLTETEMRTGIGGCLLNNYKLPFVFISNGVPGDGYTANILETNRFFFVIPNDLQIKRNKLFIQIQATISINAASRRRNLLQIQESNQIRHFMTNIELNSAGSGAAVVESAISGGATAGIIIAILLCCVLCIIAAYIYNQRTKKQTDANDSQRNLELYKVTSASANSPRAQTNQQGTETNQGDDVDQGAVVNEGMDEDDNEAYMTADIQPDQDDAQINQFIE